MNEWSWMCFYKLCQIFLILKYWTNELNELHEVLHVNERERMK